MIKIGIDFHGLIDTNTRFFSEFSNMTISAGNEVHIITSVEEHEIKDFLNKNNIKYTNFFSIIQYAKKQNIPIRYDDRGNPWVDGEFWNRAKSKYCLENKIDLHFDDSIEYLNNFKTPSALYKHK